jgi:uncharacterized protein (TIGR02145 family)
MRTLSKIALAAALGLAMTFTLSCSSGGDGSGGDDGGGGSCGAGETVIIGSQTWMKRNLNCNVSGSKCYGNDESNCAKYGRLYDWATAKAACPSGWHLPSDDEWTTLTDYVEAQKSCTSCAGEYLKSKAGWNDDGNGTDEFDFSALPGGVGYSNGRFDRVGNFGFWWSATENGASYAWYWGMRYGYTSVGRDYDDKSEDLFSVRCVQD